jgi:hypothetical protein
VDRAAQAQRVCCACSQAREGTSPSRGTGSRRTGEAPGRHRAGGAAGRVERTGGARATHRRRAVVPWGRAGPPLHSPPATIGRGVLKRAPGRATGGHTGDGAARSGPGTRTKRPPGGGASAGARRGRGRPRDSLVLGGACRAVSGARIMAGTPPNRRLRAPSGRWRGRGEAVRSPPIPIGHQHRRTSHSLENIKNE